MTSGNLCMVPKSPSEVDLRRAWEVEQALRDTGYVQLQDLDVEVRDGTACLRGRVSSYYLKQRAHVAALTVPGIRTLQDEIDVL